MSERVDSGTRTVIGDVPKSRSSVVRVSLNEFEGHHLLDLRVVETREDGTSAFTKKGCSLRIDRVEHLIHLLQKAREQALACGWLSDPEQKAA